MNMGSEKKSAETTSQKTESSSITPVQRKYQKKAFSVYGPRLGQGENIYEGDRLAGFNTTQTGVMDSLGGYNDIFSANREMPLYGETGSALSGILSGKTGATELSTDQANTVFDQSRVNPAFNTFNRTTAPILREEYAGPGYWGSARANAVAEQGTELSKSLEAERAGFLWDTENANRSIQEAKAARTLQAAPISMQYGQQPTQEALARLSGQQGVFGIASAEQQQRQRELDVNIQKFMEENRLTSQEDMSIIMALLGMNYSTSSGQSAGTASAWNPSAGYTFAQGMAADLGTAAASGIKGAVGLK